jgi:hypothetical protein
MHSGDQFKNVHHWSRDSRSWFQCNGYWYDQDASPSIPPVKASPLGWCCRKHPVCWVGNCSSHWRCADRRFQLARMFRDQPSIGRILCGFYSIRLPRSCAESKDCFAALGEGKAHQPSGDSAFRSCAHLFLDGSSVGRLDVWMG